MYQCRSGLHLWHDQTDGKMCCNGMERTLAVGNGPVEFGAETFHYWTMSDPQEYDEAYVPTSVNVPKHSEEQPIE